MKDNEYNAADAVELGEAKDVILGVKTEVPDADFSGNPPLDRQWDFG